METRRLACLIWVVLAACGGNTSALVRGQDGGAAVDAVAGDAPLGVDAAIAGDGADGPRPATDVLSSTVDLARPNVDAFDPLGACAGSYVACGCGCCGPAPGSGALPRCYYPGEGEQLSTLMADDLASRGAPTCANVGCSLGILYQCCVPAAATPATYSVDMYIGGIDRLTVHRRGDDGVCADLLLEAPSTPDGKFRVSMPKYFGLGYAAFGDCSAPGTRTAAIGGVGSIVFRRSGNGCVLDAAVSVFFPSTSGPAASLRFEVAGLAIPQMSDSQCPL